MVGISIGKPHFTSGFIGVSVLFNHFRNMPTRSDCKTYTKDLSAFGELIGVTKNWLASDITQTGNLEETSWTDNGWCQQSKQDHLKSSKRIPNLIVYWQRKTQKSKKLLIRTGELKITKLSNEFKNFSSKKKSVDCSKLPVYHAFHLQHTRWRRDACEAEN